MLTNSEDRRHNAGRWSYLPTGVEQPARSYTGMSICETCLELSGKSSLIVLSSTFFFILLAAFQKFLVATLQKKVKSSKLQMIMN